LRASGRRSIITSRPASKFANNIKASAWPALYSTEPHLFTEVEQPAGQFARFAQGLLLASCHPAGDFRWTLATSRRRRRGVAKAGGPGSIAAETRRMGPWLILSLLFDSNASRTAQIDGVGSGLRRGIALSRSTIRPASNARGPRDGATKAHRDLGCSSNRSFEGPPRNHRPTDAHPSQRPIGGR